MERSEFISRLLAALDTLPPQDRSQLQQYYEEMIDDAVEWGQSEQEVLAGFGEPEQAAARILAEYRAQPAPQAPAGGEEEPEEEPQGPQTLVYGPSAPVHAVELDVQNVPVQVEAADVDLPRVTYEGALEWDEVTVKEEGGVFRLTQRRRFRLTLGFVFVFVRQRILLQLPRDYAGDIALLAADGAVKFSGPLALGAARVQVRNGAVRLEDVRASQMALTAKNGAVHLEEVACGALDVQAANGAIRAEGCRADALLSLCSKNGAVNAHRVSASDVRLETANGAVRGELEGPRAAYTVEAHTVNGRCRVEGGPGGAGPNRVRARSTNGRVEVLFTGN